MASPRPSQSPVAEGSPRKLLTPRTKGQKLLESFDSTDDEAALPSKRNSLTQSPSSASSQPQIPHTTRLPNIWDEDSDADESDVEIRPRGKLASRMQGLTDDVKSTTTNAAETARDRVRRMLQQGASEDAQPQQTTEPTREVEMVDAVNDEEDDDDDLPVLPRRRQQRAAKSPSPEADAQPRSPSPGLFVSSPARPSPSKSAHDDDAESENELPALKSNRFKELVERKRQERLAREAEEEARNAERRAQQEKLASEMEELGAEGGNVSDITDDEGGRRLTQTAKPTRKASKKAIEEINRETQRMARSMQLAHEAKTRKKITKSSLFERFNFRPAGAPEPKVSSSSRPATPQSDVEMQDADTPPSSPPVAKKPEVVNQSETAQAEAQANEHDEFPSLDEVLASTTIKLDKGKGKAVDVPAEEEKPAPKPKRHVRVKLPPMTANAVVFDSDEELEIVKTTKANIDAVFDMVPSQKAKESNSLQALRALAHLHSPEKKTRRRGAHEMTAGELQVSLQQKARQQAKLERDRRLETLKAQGVVIQTAEERERQMQEVEDIVARAREEAEKIMQQEREDAKKEKKEGGAVDPLAWDDSEDEEYQASADEADGEASAAELSGSEDDEEDEEEDEEDDNEKQEGTALFEEEAEDVESEASAEEDEEMVPGVEAEIQDDAEELPAVSRRRARKHVTIISDDEDEDEDIVGVDATPKPKTNNFVSPTAPNTKSPAVPTSVLRSAKKTFIPGLPVQGPAGLGLTQIFAGTMDDSQMGPATGPTQSLMPDFDNFPDSNFSATMDEPEEMILDSQKDDTQKATQGIQLNFSQSQMRGLDSLLREQSISQYSEMIEMSQDGGFQEHTPLKERFMEPPHSTVDTEVMTQNEPERQDSPLLNRGRLRRRMETPLRIEETPEPTATNRTETAFNILQEAAKKEKKRKQLEEFNRKKSKAKEMVHEQAEESEDEYAGLGGADGEDSDTDSIASVKEIIDDAAGNDVDEAKLAAFYADRERAQDEKEVEKLFKDITTGMLRRKRGADYDLSDSDDGGEARRRMKRRQFAKMQKALFADERVKKIAENPGNQAFLRTIEDRGSDDEMDFLDVVDAPEESSESQSQSQDDAARQTIPDSQSRKPLAAGENRPAAHMRRTKDGKKPSNIGEVRETLSDLLDEPHGSVIPETVAGSDSEADDEPSSPARSDKENRRPRVAVVDRISLKRQASSSLSTSSSRLAFATAATSGASSFKVPALLRRATTNSLVSTTTSSGSSTPSSTTTEAKIKKNAGKRSGVNAFARDTERRARMQENERRREERKVKGAERRMGVVGGLLGRGTFE